MANVMEQSIINYRVQAIKPLLAPNMLRHQKPANDTICQHVLEARKAIENIIHRNSSRFMVIIGPCSIHDPEAALDYANKLHALSNSLSDKLLIILRVYFEKPRTTVGWKGFINDPYLDNSFEINDGLKMARELLLDINAMGLPVATEFVDTITPQYFADLISWVAIGARTVESQSHRTLASGLSMPVGFKNGTTGDVNAAVNAVAAARSPHSFLSVNEHGLAAIVNTKGNDSCHVVLRGGQSGINYDAEHVKSTNEILINRQFPPGVMIDCSHDNSHKDYRQQRKVLASIQQQIKEGERNIIGVMIESNLVEGKQPPGDFESLRYGQSITDACIGWEESKDLLCQLAETIEMVDSK